MSSSSESLPPSAFFAPAPQFPAQDSERVNVPGIVSLFNWTHRMSVTMETLAKDERLVRRIKAIARTHNRQQASCSDALLGCHLDRPSHHLCLPRVAL